MSTQQEVIKKFMASLDTTTLSGKAALDEAIKAATNYFDNIEDAIAQMIKDSKNAKNSNDFLKNYCGINLDNTDTGAITGADAGGSTSKTDASIVPESGSLKTYKKNSFTVNGLTVKLVEFPDWTSANQNITSTKNLNYKNLNYTQKYIWRAAYTWWIKNALKLIEDSYGTNYSFASKDSSVTTKTICLGFVNDSIQNGSIWYAETSDIYTDSSGNKQISMAINLGAFGSLKSDGNNLYGNPDGESALYDGIQFLDYTIAHEMTHAVMKATVNDFNSLPQFMIEGIADLTIGGDRRKNYIEDFASGKKSLKDALNLNDNGTGNIDSYVAGYMFLRWLAKQTAECLPVNLNNTVSSSVLEGTNFNDTIYNSAENVTIKAGKGADSIYNHGNEIKAWGEGGNDTFTGDYATSKIYGGSGNDFISLTTYAFNSIDGGSGNDTVIAGGRKHSVNGGKGNDRISLSGDDLTVKGGTGNDTIYSVGDRVSIFGGKGSDSIQNGALETNSKGGDSVSVNFGSGDNFFFNMQGKGVTLQAGEGKDSVHNYQGNSLRVSLGGGNDYFNAYQSKNVTVSGGDGADNLNAKGGEKFYCNAGAGNDTIWLSDAMNLSTVIGGKGNDSIRLQNTMQNLIVYTSGDGKDTITGFGATDTLSIADISYSAKASGADLRVTVDKGSILLKGASKFTSNIVFSVTNSTKSPVTVSSTVKNIDASKRTKAIQITGNKLANSITGSSKNDKIYGGAGDDTLRGGKGNDSLWGNAGADTFSYESGDGKDTISGFANNDMLQITGTFSGTYNKSKKEIYFKVDSTKNAITLKNFTATTFHVNGDAYHISGKKLVK